MTALATTAPTLTKQELKDRRKQEKKRLNKLIGNMDTTLTDVQHALWGAQDRVAEAYKAVTTFGADVPTQGVRDYLQKINEVLALGVELSKGEGSTALDAVVEHLFPGRVERIRQENEQRVSDSYTQTMERYAGHSGE